MVMKRLLIPAAAGLMLMLSGCGAGSGHAGSAGATRSAAPSGGTVHVAIRAYAFSPPTLTVASGTRVIFTNDDQTAHTATSMTPGFDTGTVAPAASRSITLRKPGSYSYYCQFHAFMKATIVVR